MAATIAELEAEHDASWTVFEKECLDAIGPEVANKYVDAGSDIPGLIIELHKRYRAEIQREQSRRIEAETQRDTYKRIASIRKK